MLDTRGVETLVLDTRGVETLVDTREVETLVLETVVGFQPLSNLIVRQILSSKVVVVGMGRDGQVEG